MRHYDTSFFCEEGKGPKVFVERSEPGDQFGWPIFVKINTKGDRLTDPSVTFYLKTTEDLLEFKHSIVLAVNKSVEAEDVE